MIICNSPAQILPQCDHQHRLCICEKQSQVQGSQRRVQTALQGKVLCREAGKGTLSSNSSGAPGGFEPFLPSKPFLPSTGTSLVMPESHPWEDPHQMSLWEGRAGR